MKYKIFLLILLAFSISIFSQNDDKSTEYISSNKIEKAPVYPGCKGKDNESLKKCMSKKIIRHIKKNFNTSIAISSGLPKGTYTINVQCTINKKGKFTNVKARGTILELEIEAIRVIYSLPKTIPGMNNGKEVNVLYSIPINFEI